MGKNGFRLFVVVCFVQLVNAEPIVLDTVSGVYEGMSYRLMEDDDDLVLTLVTSDKATVRRLLRMGTVFYFDVKGKKNKSVYVRYPLPGKRPEMAERPLPDEEGPDLTQLLANLPQEGEYGAHGETELFHPMLNSLGIEIVIEATTVEKGATSEEGLLYRLRIPKGRIAIDPGTDLSRLSVGVGSNPRQEGEKAEKPVDGKPSMGRGGGRRGGSRGGGRAGAMSPRNAVGPKERPVVDPIDFWFDAHLEQD
ncbi:hypothetical protein [Pseudozobellia thermophila]|uniref:Uncharacterized protein n=1 Tax=Pseudozobellia thermophila TaxID=192903 RepID=A0A1M6KCF6_9FLAO|nr:hypothetical protein [Pseudozobellia thermophila]SHJ56663.1 hypothetical protein SAMN04488513_10613 [Pseudozobellia thermophila]